MNTSTKEEVVYIMQNFIETVPKKRELDEVLDWLKCERDCDKRGYGFYNNRNIIEDAFEKDNLIIFKHAKMTRGEMVRFRICI